MLSFIINIIGMFIIFIAIDYNRPEEYKAELFSKDWWVQIIMVAIASVLIGNSYLIK